MKVKAKVIRFNSIQNRVLVEFEGREYMDNTGKYDGKNPYFEIDIPVVNKVAETEVKEDEITES